MAGVGVSLSPSKKQFLRRLYQDPHHPGSLGGARRLYEAARLIRQDITFKDVQRFLEDSRAYTLHKLQPKKFKRRAILSPKPRVIMAADLADMKVLAPFNHGVKYILVCVDAFSRYAKCLPLTRKDANSMVSAMKKVLEEENDIFKGVSRLFVDRGKEFYNRQLQSYLESKRIKTYSVYSQETKSAIAERFIRTLKARLYRYMTAHNTLEYVSALGDVVESYNHSRHSVLGKTPAKVHALRKPDQLIKQFKKMHYKSKENVRDSTSRQLNIGDHVRLVGAERSSKFSRGFNIQNTEEIFKIDAVDHRQYPVAYIIKDLSNQPIQGLFYREELVKVQLPEVFPIIIKKSRIVNGRKQFYVSWLGYDDTQDGWIDATDIS